MNYRHFEVEQVGDTAIVRVNEAHLFETLVITEFEDDLLDFLEAEGPRNMVVSFARVANGSTAVINGMLRAKKRVVLEGGGLWLCEMCPIIRDAYRLLNLDGTVFQIVETVTDALQEIVARRTAGGPAGSRGM